MAVRLCTALIALLLSIPAWAQVSLTFLATEGVLLEAGEDKVIIDAFIPEQYAIFGGLTTAAAAQQANASGIFSGIDLALVSHMHFEHFQPDAACRFMRASPATRLITSRQVITVMQQRCKTTVNGNRNIKTVTPATGVPHRLNVGDIQAEIFHLSHGQGKFASLEHFGHIVTIGGMRVLHLGDAASAPADFVVAGLQNKPVDIALVPYTFLLRASGRLIMQQYIKADHVLVAHIPPKEVESLRAELSAHFADVKILAEPMQNLYFEPDKIRSEGGSG